MAPICCGSFGPQGTDWKLPYCGDVLALVPSATGHPVVLFLVIFLVLG